MSSGQRNDIYSHIDGLSSARSLDELIAKLQPILHNLAYFAMDGDKALMDDNEDWHQDYTEEFFGDVKDKIQQQRAVTDAYNASQKEIAAAAPRTRQGAPPGRQKSGGRGSTRGDRDDDVDDTPGWHERKAVSRRAEDIPDSLRAIFEGTHPSFKQKDDDLMRRKN